MRALLLVGGGILIGVGLSYAEASVRAEKKIREVEEEYWAKRVEDKLTRDDDPYRFDSYGNERGYDSEAPAETEDELSFNADGIIFGDDGTIMTPELQHTPPPGYVQEYVEKAAVYGDSAHMLQPQPMEIIDDDQYSEEDGRAKEQIQAFMGDGEPYFVQDGLVIEDWKEKIGDNILVMFYQNFTPDYTGARVIYIRNHERGEDFEVLQEMGP